jgi:site-specific recombinase XerD
MSVKQQVDGYIADLILRNYANETIEGFKYPLYMLAKFCRETLKIEDLNLFTNEQMDIFLDSYLDIRPTTAIIYSKKILHFFKYLKKQGIINHELKPRRIFYTKETKTFHNLTILKLIRSKLTKHLDRAMFDLILQTGLEISEVIHLKKDDINWTTGSMIIRNSRGIATRTLFVDKKLLHTIQLRADNHPTLVFSNKGELVHRRYLNNQLNIVGRELGITITPDTLRYSFAVLFHKEMKDIRALQLILGHKDISHTENFIKQEKYSIKEKLVGFHKILRKERPKYVSTENL